MKKLGNTINIAAFYLRPRPTRHLLPEIKKVEKMDLSNQRSNPILTIFTQKKQTKEIEVNLIYLNRLIVKQVEIYKKKLVN